MPLNVAHRQALETFGKLNPLVAANKSGAEYSDGRFSLRLLHRNFAISHPEGKVVEVRTESATPLSIQVLLLHYLIHATGASIADRWVAFRELPGAYLVERKFDPMAIIPLTRIFGKDIQGFRRAGLALGGIPMDRAGDAAFRFLALPRLPLACILYLGEEEIPASVNVLFDASAPEYLPTEDLSILGLHLATSLIKLGEGKASA
ncbi:MAG: DUF3786 domain-containing protein [Chloroflexi bacterium]|nr:DUF3786 domain-containing protein [Chloroflexota bacterium]